MVYLFRKQLMVDTDSQELMRIKQILDANQIPYDVKTTVGENVLSRNFNAKAAAYRYTTYSDTARQTYVYYLYVRHRDYARAKELAGIR